MQREAAVGQQEAHAAKAVLEAYCARYRDQAELEAALQRATELQAALQAAEEHHSRASLLPSLSLASRSGSCFAARL